MRCILRGRRSTWWSWRVPFRRRRSIWWHFGRWPERQMLYFSIQNRLHDGTSKVSEAAGARWRFYPRIMFGLCSECRRIVFLLAEAIHGVSAEILNLQISWQAQYLVRLEADCACSAHCKWRFICDADQSWDWFCVAGAVLGEVRGWLCLLRAF